MITFEKSINVQYLLSKKNIFEFSESLKKYFGIFVHPKDILKLDTLITFWNFWTP